MSMPICTLGAMTNANKLPCARCTSARVPTSSVCMLTIFLTVCPTSPQWIILFTIAAHTGVCETEIASKHTSPSSKLYHRSSLWGGRARSQFTLCLLLNTAFWEVYVSNLTYNGETWASDKIRWENVLPCCLCVFADVGCCSTQVRTVTIQKEKMQCGVGWTNVEIKSAASVMVFPDFILGCIGTLWNKGKFNRLLCQSRAGGWKGFLTPAKPLRTLDSEGLWASEQEHVHSPVIILFLARCVAIGAWSWCFSISIITAKLRRVPACWCVCLLG